MTHIAPAPEHTKAEPAARSENHTTIRTHIMPHTRMVVRLSRGGAAHAFHWQRRWMGAPVKAKEIAQGKNHADIRVTLRATARERCRTIPERKDIRF